MELFTYLIKVSACSALFFAFYLLVLRKLTFFKINRFYLLASLLLSFIIPALQFTIERELQETVVVSEPTVRPDIDDVELTRVQTPITVNTPPVIQDVEQFDWLSLLPYVYVLVVASLLVLAAWRIIQLLKHTKCGVKEINGLKLVAKEKGFTNCSFFNYVFIDENNLTETELAILLAHEEVHAKQYHSVDKLALMIAKAVLWFNPIVYLFDKALEETHEYEADDTTSKSIGTESYASLLLKLAVSKSSTTLIHNFVKSPIKQRIKMLFNSKSTNMKKLAYLLALPIGLGLIWGFTVDIVNVFPSQEKEFTLVIDAGHGGKEKGSTSNGVSEKEIVLSMSKKLKAFAEENGIKVITTRANDSNLSLQDRTKAEGSFLISLHVNAQPKGTDRNGVEMFVSRSASGLKTTEDKIKMSRSIGMTYDLYKSMKNVAGIAVSNRPKHAALYLLENSKLPAVVLELGFLSNKRDFQFITNDKKQDELAKAIIDGVLSYKRAYKTDAEIKAFQENANHFTKRHEDWLGSDQRKSILAKAAKIKAKTINGKIESLHYFSVNNVLDGFILNANGERYRVYLTDSQLKQVYLKTGDAISLKANQVEAWYDSEYPVIKTLEILSTNKVGKSNVITYPAPVLLSSTDVQVFGKTNTLLITGAVMKIFNGDLEAEYIEMDSKKGIVTAKNAKYSRASGYLIKSDLMVFDTKKGTFTVNSPPTGTRKPNSAAFEMLSKLNFTKSDSIKVMKIMDRGIILTGNVKMKIDNYLINARVITANSDSNIITAYLGSLTNGDRPSRKAEMIEFDLVTKEIKFDNTFTLHERKD